MNMLWDPDAGFIIKARARIYSPAGRGLRLQTPAFVVRAFFSDSEPILIAHHFHLFFPRHVALDVVRDLLKKGVISFPCRLIRFRVD